MITLFLTFLSNRNWRGTWSIKVSGLTNGAIRSIDMEYKLDWDQPVPAHMEEKLYEVPEEFKERCGYIMRIFCIGCEKYPPCQIM